MTPQILNKINKARPAPAPKSIPWADIMSTPEKTAFVIEYVGRLVLHARRERAKDGR